MPPKIIMLIGFPASTKSSFAKEIQENTQNVTVLSRDNEGGKLEDLLPKVEEAINDNKVVILDNTHLTKQSRKPFIELAKRLKVPVHGHYFKTSIEDCQIRHLKRMYEKFGQIHQTGYSKDPHGFGPIVLFKAKNDFELPSKSEGFKFLILHTVPQLSWDETIYKNKALFIDLDGTIRVTEHLQYKYPTEPGQVQLIKPKHIMREILDSYRNQGYYLIGLTNQSGVSRGTLTPQKVEEIFEKTRSELGYTQEEFPILYCPHHPAPIKCFCRKPQSGMAMECVMRLKINPHESIMVGDMKSDETMAERLGIKYIDVNAFW
jgi:histidinol-phosphate phosphatase family protein